MSRFGKLCISSKQAELVKAKFVELASPFEEPPQGGLASLFSLVGAALGLAPRRVRHIIKAWYGDPNDSRYDDQLKLLCERVSRKRRVQSDEVDLVKQKFLELARYMVDAIGEGTFIRGIMPLYRLVAKDLGMQPFTVRDILRRRVSCPSSPFYDEEVVDLHENLKLKRGQYSPAMKLRPGWPIKEIDKHLAAAISKQRSLTQERIKAIQGRKFDLGTEESKPEQKKVKERRFREGLITRGDAELVKRKFVGLVESFEGSPKIGVTRLLSLVAKQSGIALGRVQTIIYSRLCNPQSDLYDERFLALKKRATLTSAEVGARDRNQLMEFKERKQMENEENKEFRSKWQDWKPGDFAYSETGQILGAMETRLQEVEMASVILKKEKEDLQRENKRLQKKNDRQLSQLIERDKQFVSLREAKSEGIKDRAANVQQAGVILNHVARIEVLEEKNSEACQRIKNLLHLKGEKLALCAKQDKLLLELAKRDDKIKKLREEKDSQLRVHRQTAAENKAIKKQVQDQGSRIQQVESLSAERAAKIEELEKELKASRDGDTAGKKAEATFIKRWSNRFLPKVESSHLETGKRAAKRFHEKKKEEKEECPF